jgi:tripartite-type tricarboxylate transporter receptor subunit TctC
MAALASGDLKKQYDTFNATPTPATPQQFAAFVLAEQAKWGPVVLKTGVKLD